jgi:hypothetical protein
MSGAAGATTVLDNASTDCSAAMVRHDYACGPQATLLEESAFGPFLRYVPGLRELYAPTASQAYPRRVTSTRAQPWPSATALSMRRGFDTDFFMYFEEVDPCYRWVRLGWR